MPNPCRAAAAAFASRVTESDLPVLRRLNASQRRDFALDLCALLDFATPGGEPVSGSPPPNAGGLRAAVMIDHVPGMTSRAACALVDRLSLASRRSVPDVRNLRVFEVHDVVIIAHAPRLRDELLGWRGSASTRRRRLVDVLPAAEPAMRAALVADALARAAGALEGEGGEGGEESEAERDDARDEQKQSRPRDLVAALGALADAVPPPTLVGACLGYPRVYSWSKAGDVAAAARALSSETLRVYAVYARFRGVEKNGTTRRVCGFTVPAREAWEEGAGSRNEASPSSESRSNRLEAEDEDEAVTSVDGDARAWLEAMRERAAAGGDVWTDLELRVETRGAGPVAL
jgi:hypothetical protein